LAPAFLTSAIAFPVCRATGGNLSLPAGGRTGLILCGAHRNFFVLLGCFLDGISIVLLTTSVVMPRRGSRGIDPGFGFGIYLIHRSSRWRRSRAAGGFNLFVIQT